MYHLSLHFWFLPAGYWSRDMPSVYSKCRRRHGPHRESPPSPFTPRLLSLHIRTFDTSNTKNNTSARSTGKRTLVESKRHSIGKGPSVFSLVSHPRIDWPIGRSIAMASARCRACSVRTGETKWKWHENESLMRCIRMGAGLSIFGKRIWVPVVIVSARLVITIYVCP